MHLENPLERNIYFYSDVEQETIGELTQAIIEIETHDKRLARVSEAYGFKYQPQPIQLYVNSYGGDVYACLGLISIMKSCTTPIHTYVTGCAMSAGFVIAINGHKRFCYGNSTYMLHQLSSVSWGKIQERVERLSEDKRLQKLLDINILEHSNLTKSKLKEVYTTKVDKFYSASAAVDMGLVDVIL